MTPGSPCSGPVAARHPWPRFARSLFLVCWTLGLAAPTTLAQPLGGAIPSDAPRLRCLFILDTSYSMHRVAAAVQEALLRAVYTGLDGRLERGQAFAIWTFDDDVHTTRFPPTPWVPELSAALASRARNFVVAQRWTKRGRPVEAITELNRLLRQTPTLTVFLLTDGQDPIGGTPFDRAVNALFTHRYRELRQAKQFFVIAFEARDGRLVAWRGYPSGEPFRLPDLPAPAPLASATAALAPAPGGAEPAPASRPPSAQTPSPTRTVTVPYRLEPEPTAASTAPTPPPSAAPATPSPAVATPPPPPTPAPSASPTPVKTTEVAVPPAEAVPPVPPPAQPRPAVPPPAVMPASAPPSRPPPPTVHPRSEVPPLAAPPPERSPKPLAPAGQTAATSTTALAPSRPAPPLQDTTPPRLAVVTSATNRPTVSASAPGGLPHPSPSAENPPPALASGFPAERATYLLAAGGLLLVAAGLLYWLVRHRKPTRPASLISQSFDRDRSPPGRGPS